jgi:hypothetical protein
MLAKNIIVVLVRSLEFSLVKKKVKMKKVKEKGAHKAK